MEREEDECYRLASIIVLCYECGIKVGNGLLEERPLDGCQRPLRATVLTYGGFSVCGEPDRLNKLVGKKIRSR